jgi:hypothetical protein
MKDVKLVKNMKKIGKIPAIGNIKIAGALRAPEGC